MCCCEGLFYLPPQLKIQMEEVIIVDSCKQYDSKEVGLRVKNRAKQMGYTVQSLAEKMNVEYATISRIYRGLSVKIEYIYELSEILNVSTDYLLKGRESDKREDVTSNRAAYMQFLSELSDKELEQTVMHAKITLGMYSSVY